MAKRSSAHLENIPSVEKVKQTPKVSELLNEYSDDFITDIIRDCLEEIRSLRKKADRDTGTINLSAVENEVVERVHARLASPLRRVINGTGIIIHTNLGRSIMGSAVTDALKEAAERYCALEIDLQTGERGQRDSLVEPLICELTGAEAATVVNNNAAAVMISLDTLAKGGEVIVSRGELIEIGGSFRMPDVMEKSGARLVEVGTTNRTYAADYERALSPDTALLLKVHPSNYRIVGFTSQVMLSELVELGRKRGIPVMEDLGSGALVDMSKYGLFGEPMPRNSIDAGADIVTFSGDKLLGGPQAGIIIGRQEYINAIKKNPLKRALRVDKLTLSALGALLQILLSSRQPEKEIPILGMMARSIPEIHEMAQTVLDKLGADVRKALSARIIEGESQVGGGSCPAQNLPTKLLILKSMKDSPDTLAERLRQRTPPIVGVIRKDSFCLDFRTVQADELPEIIAALHSLVQK